MVKVKKPKVIKDTYGREIKTGDRCLFWNNNPKVRVEYKFYDWYDVPNALCEINNYISIDEEDDDDLSWWKNCEKIN